MFYQLFSIYNSHFESLSFKNNFIYFKIANRQMKTRQSRSSCDFGEYGCGNDKWCRHINSWVTVHWNEMYSKLMCHLWDVKIQTCSVVVSQHISRSAALIFHNMWVNIRSSRLHDYLHSSMDLNPHLTTKRTSDWHNLHYILMKTYSSKLLLPSVFSVSLFLDKQIKPFHVCSAMKGLAGRSRLSIQNLHNICLIFCATWVLEWLTKPMNLKRLIWHVPFKRSSLEIVAHLWSGMDQTLKRE